MSRIVVIEAELCLAAVLAIYMALTAGFVGGACAFAAGGDTGSCCPLPGKVGDRRARMVIRIGNVNEMVRVNPNLEKVSETPVRATKQAAGRDLPGVVGGRWPGSW